MGIHSREFRKRYHIGGLWKSAGSVALFAAAGLFVGGVAMPSAKAADLGGDCCADLEERVAELEATTVRKGNRRVSLTLYGWVNKAVLYWNDGIDSNTHFGVDNTNFATRFGLRGDARVNPNLKAGFSILIDVITGANTGAAGGINQLREDTTLQANGATSTASAIAGVNAYSEDHAFRMRDANVWLEHTQLGRLTVGHLTNPGPQGIIDLGGVAVASVAAIDLMGGGFIFRRSDGAFTGATIANNTTNTADFSHRTDSIRWDSPSIGGFIIGAAIGEAAEQSRTVSSFNPITATGPVGTYWAANIRYAGEFAGFRVAAAAAYESSENEERMNSSAATTGAVLQDGSNNIGLSGSLLHVPSGLFVQGSWIRFERPNVFGAGLSATDDGTLWHIQAGIAKNWTGLGNTALYGEYANGQDLQATFSNTNSLAQANRSNEYTMWGLGIVQNIDAASMELYLGYRRHSLDRDIAGLTAVNAGAVFGLKQGDVAAGAAVEDIHIVHGGMRIGF